MQQRVLSSTLLLAALAAAGCEQSRTPTEVGNLEATFAAKGGGATTTTETDPMTIWVFDATFTDAAGKVQQSGITADPAGPYEGGKCGVTAHIFWTSGNHGGDGVFDADKNNPGKCTKRYLNFHMPSGTVRDAPFTNVIEIMYAELDKPRDQHLRFTNTNMRSCERIRFGERTATDEDPRWVAETPGVRVTRTAGTARTRGGGKWAVESLPPHEAQCLVFSGGDYVPNGAPFPLPFRVEITELPSTGPNY